MADFPVYQPQQGGNGLDMLLNDILRRNALQQQQKNQTQDEIQRAVLGASTGDMAVYAPEIIKSLPQSTSREEVAQKLLAASRKTRSLMNRQASIEQGINAYGKTVAAGQDPSAIVSQVQGDLTSNAGGDTLPPDIIAVLQKALGTAATAGSATLAAQRLKVNEEKAAQLALAKETSAIDEARNKRETDYRITQGEAADIRKEKRDAESHLAEQYQVDARNFGLPPDTPRELVDEERTRRRLNLPADPKVFEANQKAWEAWNRDRTAKEDRTQGSIDDMIERSRELNVNATGQGASIVFGIVRDGGWLGTGFREKARVVPMGGDVARANLGQMYAAAQNGDADAKKAFSFMERLAETNPGVKRAFEDVVPKPDADRANAVLEELFNFQNTPGAAEAKPAAKGQPSRFSKGSVPQKGKGGQVVGEDPLARAAGSVKNALLGRNAEAQSETERIKKKKATSYNRGK